LNFSVSATDRNLQKQRLAVVNIVRRMGHVMVKNDTSLVKALG
jgi:hypothetical protein